MQKDFRIFRGIRPGCTIAGRLLTVLCFALAMLDRARALDVIQFVQTNYSALENAGSLSIQLQRTGALLDFAPVWLEMGPGTARPGEDFRAITNQVTFRPGESNQTLAIELLNDTAVEGTETFSLLLKTTDPFCCVLGTNLQAVVTIEDNDLGIHFAAGTYFFMETAGEVPVTVERVGDQVNQPGLVRVAVTNWGIGNFPNATNGVDYLVSTNELVFQVGQTNATILVTIINDQLREGSEEFQLRLLESSTNSPVGAQAITRIVILDNDLGVEFVQARYEAVEGGPAIEVQLHRIGEPSDAFTVDLLSNGSALANVDLQLPTNRLHFAQDQTNLTLTIPILDDPLIEGDETMTLVLSNATAGVPLGAKRSCELRLHDNEYPVNLIDAAFPSGPEGVTAALLEPDGSIIIATPVRRLRPDGSEDPSFSSFRPDGTIAALARQPDGKILCAGSFTYALLGNFYFGVARLHPNGSLDESFVPNLGSSGFARCLQLQANGMVLVGGFFRRLDNSRVALVRLAGDGTRDESFQVAFDNPSVVSMAMVADGGIVIGGPFASVQGEPRIGLARLQPTGALDPAFNARLSPNTWAAAMAAWPDGNLAVAITAGSNPGRRLVRLHGATGLADPTFTPPLATNSSLQSITLQADGKILVLGNIIGAGGSRLGAIVRLHADGSLDNYRSEIGSGFLVWSAEQILTARNGQLVRLLPEMPEFSLSFAGSGLFSALESDGTASITVERGGNSGESLSVGFAAIGPASSGVNFLPETGTITFQPLETRKNITLAVVSDCLSETNKNVEIRLTQVPPGGVIAPPTRGILTIFDDDAPGSLENISLAEEWFPPNEPASLGATVALQADGKILVARRGAIIRLNPDGSLDPSFVHGASVCADGCTPICGLKCSVSSMVVQRDGKILAGGYGSIIRLQPNGVLDTNYSVLAINYVGHGMFGPGTVRKLILQADGKLLAAGDFTALNGSCCRNLVRLNPDGTVDGSFSADGALGYYALVLAQPDGKLLVAHGGTLGRLRNNGQLDPAFPMVHVEQVINTLALFPNGRILVGGRFNYLSGKPASGLGRIQADGSLDPSFDTTRIRISEGDLLSVQALAVEQSGSILVAGEFSGAGIRVVRLDPEGRLDTNFSSALEFSDSINSIQEQADGKLLLAGAFDNASGLPRPGWARMLSDRTALLFRVPLRGENGSIRLVTRSRPGGTYILQTSPDLSSWSDLSTNLARDCTLELEDTSPAFGSRFYRLKRP